MKHMRARKKWFKRYMGRLAKEKLNLVWKSNKERNAWVREWVLGRMGEQRDQSCR